MRPFEEGQVLLFSVYRLYDHDIVLLTVFDVRKIDAYRITDYLTRVKGIKGKVDVEQRTNV